MRPVTTTTDRQSPGAASRALAAEARWFLLAAAIALTVGSINFGWEAGLLAVAVALIIGWAVVYLTRAETRRLRDLLGDADDELDILDALRPRYDALVDLTAAIVATRSGTKEERTALRALRTATPPTAEPEDVTA